MEAETDLTAIIEKLDDRLSNRGFSKKIDNENADNIIYHSSFIFGGGNNNNLSIYCLIWKFDINFCNRRIFVQPSLIFYIQISMFMMYIFDCYYNENEFNWTFFVTLFLELLACVLIVGYDVLKYIRVPETLRK